jgi:hypothetical protein
MDLAGLSEKVVWSASGRQWDTSLARGVGGWVAAPNHSQGYHGLLRQWWETYGLGGSCLLVSESRKVSDCFQQLYPETKMVATDYYLDLNSKESETDVVWNLYESIPQDLAAMQFHSVVCQATFEHLLDPVGVLRNLTSLLVEGGHLYLHTHTPLFPYHGWPKDYLRFFPEWFRDVSLLIPEIEAIEVCCVAGHAFACYCKHVAAATPARGAR